MSEILERGNVYFLYWPAKGEEHAESVADVQRFFLVLHPEGAEQLRRVVVGHKKLPEAAESGSPGARFWGYVDRVVPADEAEKAVERRPESNLSGPAAPAARPAGEGVYALVRHGNHTDLAIELTTPEEPGEAQRALNIPQAASYVLSVKNPEVGAPAGAGLDPERQPELPDELRARFGDRRWGAADPPSFLDHEGVELLFVAGREDLPGDVEEDLRCAEPATRQRPRLFDDLGIEPDERVVRAMQRGEWA